jgi:hypothetical protein
VYLDESVVGADPVARVEPPHEAADRGCDHQRQHRRCDYHPPEARCFRFRCRGMVALAYFEFSLYRRYALRRGPGSFFGEAHYTASC